MANEKPSRESNLQDSHSVSLRNKFRNDGSFLEMFKQMQNASAEIYGISNVLPKVVENKDKDTTEINIDAKSDDEQMCVSKPSVSIGRRKGGRTLPVGKVKKAKTDDAASGENRTSSNAWAKYLDEVKKYKETYCESESHNRSLVK